MKRLLMVVGLINLLGTMSVSQADTAAPTPTGAGSSDELSEIIVTAERRTSDLQKTPVSISVRGGEDLREEGKYSLQQILEDVPGVSGGASTGTANGGTDLVGSGITIRGVEANGQPSGQILSAVPATAVYTDGIYEGVGGSYDIDRVEVLRGPQGTLYGRSATAGVVATYTHNPDLDKFGGYGSVEFGNYALQHYDGALNLPLIDQILALRISANEYKRDGYDSKHGGALETTDVRTKLLYRPVDSLSILLGVAIEDNHTHSGGLQGNIVAPETFDYTSVPVQPGKNIFRQYWADINWDFGFASLTYEPAFRSWYQNTEVYATGPGGGSLAQKEYTPFDQFSTQELRLESDPNSALKWLIGAFYYDNRLRDANIIDWQDSGALVASAAARKETKDFGIYGQSTYSITDSTRVSAGVRYDYTYVQTNETYTTNVNLFCGTALFYLSPTSAACLPGYVNSPQSGLPEDDVALSVGGQAGTRRFYNTTYMLRLEQDLTATNLVYGSLATGFLPGDVQIATGANNQPFATPYAEETLTSIELGSKNRFLNNTLELNGDIFHYHYTGYQTQITPDPRNPGTQVLVTVPSRMYGAEVEIKYLPTPDDRIGFNYGYTKSYFVDQSAQVLAAVALSQTPNVIPQSINASYDHFFHLPGGSTLDPHGDARFLSAHDINAISPTYYAEGGEALVRNKNQVIGNFSLGWNSADKKYSVTSYVRNVGNKRFVNTIILQSVTPVSATGSQYDPRTFGIVLSAAF